jgi:type I restriction-modification system DNA methylase subunit
MSNLNSVFKSIRDILRQEGITGMDSINHCLVFLIARFLDKELCKKTDIDEKYSFDNLMKTADGKERGDQDLYDLFYMKAKPCLCFMLLNKLKFNNGKFKLTGIVNLKSIMRLLEKLDVKHLNSQYDLVGTIYELHLKSGTSNAMRDLGQYFTHRLVIKYMVELCKPTLIDGKIETIVDPTMGTGGFLTMAIKYLNQKHPKIDWTKNIENIYGFDLDENVKNMALLNVLLECGELSTKLVQQDTLKNDLKLDSVNTLLKSKIILANEPMGIKGLKYTDCCDRIKTLKINGTKAEPLFLQLIMEALDDEGRCAVIVPDGVLFNDSNQHNGTRKHLIENFNLKKVISLNDSEFFLNTGVKTSILFFCKDGKKTQEVEFCEIKLENDSIKENSIIKVKYQTIKDNNYSLFVNKYNFQEVEKIDGITYKKLGDVCEIKFGKRVIKSEVAVEDDYTGIKYPCYGGGGISFYTKEYNREGKNLVISRFGVSEKCVRIISDKFYLNDSGLTLHATDKNLLQSFLEFYTIMCLQSKIFDISMGACQKNIQVEDLKSFEIPIPSISIQKEIVERLDVIHDNTKTLEKNVEDFKKMIKYHVDAHIKNVKDVKKLDDLFNFNIGSKTSKDVSANGTYDFYNGSAKSPVGKADDFSFDNNSNYILLIKDGGAGSGKYGDQIGLGKVFYVYGKTSFTTSVVALTNKDNKTINMKYAYHYLYYIKNKMMDLANYTVGLGHLTTKKLKLVEIKIPSLEKQQEIVKYCDNLSDMITKMESQIENNQTLMKDIMDMYLKTVSE